MRLEYQILTAVVLDLVLGDPRWLPHPTRGIGRLAHWLEPRARYWIGPPKLAGIATAMTIYATAGFGVWGTICLARQVCPLAADAVSIVAIYTTIAARDLSRHSTTVFRCLVAGDLGEARRRVSWLVGRDTLAMDAGEVVRAALESVGESTVDGVTAPLFYAVLAGPVGAVVYRAINTLDSMFGHLDESYREFGWASARIDDLANYVPARITAPLVCLASVFFTPRPRHALRILARDGRKHASPNSGLAEAAMAGALGVQLGGANHYDGEAIQRAKIGDPLLPLAAWQIPRANTLMWTTAALFLAICLAARAGVVHCCDGAARGSSMLRAEPEPRPKSVEAVVRPVSLNSPDVLDAPYVHRRSFKPTCCNGWSLAQNIGSRTWRPVA
jgi:adenosylcobinamide-phosphate synthase